MAKALGIPSDTFLGSIPVGEMYVVNHVRQSALLQAEPDLMWLSSNGYIDYHPGNTVISPGGTFTDLHFRRTDTFVQDIAPELQL